MMQHHRRKFSDRQKQDIVAEASLRGTNLVLREHNISYSVYARWKQKFMPVEHDSNTEKNTILQMLKNLNSENERLKKIVANQALEIQIRDELLGPGQRLMK